MTEFWFKRKRFGWGLQPCSKEGWLMTGLLILGFALFGSWYGTTGFQKLSMLEYILVLFFGVFMFIYFADKKAERPLLFKRNQHQKE